MGCFAAASWRSMAPPSASSYGRQAREAAKEREKFEKERRRDLAEKAALKRRQEEEIRKAAEENKARLAAKAEERYKEQEESRRIALLQVPWAGCRVPLSLLYVCFQSGACPCLSS